jgi:hypothetical protein
MARVVIIGIPGEAGLWMADLDAGTVTAVDGALSDELITAQANNDETMVKGVRLAVAINSGSELAGGFLER